MSAFVVSTDTMKRACLAICGRNRYGQIIRTFAGIRTDEPDAATKIGRRLFTMNIEAVYQRYPDTQDTGQLPGNGNDLELPTTFRCPEPRPLPMATGALAAGIKALGCLRYQCSEGDAPESPMYQALEEAIGVLSYEVVARMPEYEAAPWG